MSYSELKELEREEEGEGHKGDDWGTARMAEAVPDDWGEQREEEEEVSAFEGEGALRRAGEDDAKSPVVSPAVDGCHSLSSH